MKWLFYFSESDDSACYNTKEELTWGQKIYHAVSKKSPSSTGGGMNCDKHGVS